MKRSSIASKSFKIRDFLRRILQWHGHLVETWGNKSADQNLSEERLKILANVAIEQVPFPEQGMLTEEDAGRFHPVRPELVSTASKACPMWQRRLPQPPHLFPLHQQRWTLQGSNGSSAAVSTWLKMFSEWLSIVSMKVFRWARRRSPMAKMPPAKTATRPNTTANRRPNHHSEW